MDIRLSSFGLAAISMRAKPASRQGAAAWLEIAARYCFDIKLKSPASLAKARNRSAPLAEWTKTLAPPRKAAVAAAGSDCAGCAACAGCAVRR